MLRQMVALSCIDNVVAIYVERLSFVGLKMEKVAGGHVVVVRGHV